MPPTLELNEQHLQARCRKLGYAPDDYLFRITVTDVVTVLAQRLAKDGILAEQLTQPDLDHLIDQASEYLNGEGMPPRKGLGVIWQEIVSLGLAEAWPEHLNNSKETA